MIHLNEKKPKKNFGLIKNPEKPNGFGFKILSINNTKQPFVVSKV